MSEENLGADDVVVDCAGAVMGGALRFVQELDEYLVRRNGGVRQVGRGNMLSLRWLLEREKRAGACQHTVALNNVSFVFAGRFRTVLLRNALHFLSGDERTDIRVAPAQHAHRVVVRTLMDRADRIVVPTTSMAERVCGAKPRAADRIRVMHHPVTPLPLSPERGDVILCPVLDAPYKKLSQGLADMVDCVQMLRKERAYAGLELLLTLTMGEAAALQLSLPSFVRLLGRLTPQSLRRAQQSAGIIFYPTTVESFGYPLAEARLSRQPVIAQDTAHVREVAGDALVVYRPSEKATLADAVRRAFGLNLQPIAGNPFDPDSYFDRLLSTS